MSEKRYVTTIVLDIETYRMFKYAIAYKGSEFIERLLQEAYDNNRLGDALNIPLERTGTRFTRFVFRFGEKTKRILSLIPKSKRSAFIRKLLWEAHDDGRMEEYVKERENKRLIKRRQNSPNA